MKAKIYIAPTKYAYRAAEDGQSIQFLDTSMNLGWKHSDYMTDKVLKAARPAQEVLDEEAARRGWQPWEEPEEAPTPQSNAVQLAKDVLDAVRHFKGELTADGCRQAVGKSYFGRSGLDTGGYRCSPRGVKLAPKGEDFMDLTWAKFIKFCREHSLIEEKPLKAASKPALERAEENPIHAAEGAPTCAPTASDAQPSPLPSAAGFDFGADAETNAMLLQDAQIFMAGSMARVMAAKRAHDRTAHNYRGSWGKWCELVGISRDTGDNMVRVAEQFGNIQVDGHSLIDLQPLKLLYAASRPSTPPEVRAKVESLEITSHKEYQELLAQLKTKEQELEDEKASRKSENAAFSELLADEQQRRQAANEAKIKAENIVLDLRSSLNTAKANENFASRRADEAEKALAGARDALTAAKARGDRWQEKCEALEAQAAAPAIEARVVDPEEVEQLAAERAEALAAQQMAQRDAEDARAAYDAVILATRSMDAAWQALAPMLPRLAPEEKSQAIHQFVNKLMCIKEDVLKCL